GEPSGANSGRARTGTDGTPFRAPFTCAFTAARTAHVLDGPDPAHQQLEQFSERRLVVRTPPELRRGIERHGLRDVEEDRGTDTADRAGGVPGGDSARVPERDRSREKRGERQHQPPGNGRDRTVCLAREPPSRLAKYGLGVGTPADEPRERDRFVHRRGPVAPARPGVPL